MGISSAFCRGASFCLRLWIQGIGHTCVALHQTRSLHCSGTAKLLLGIQKSLHAAHHKRLQLASECQQYCFCMFLFVVYRYVVSNKYPKMNWFHLFSSVFYVLVCLMKTWMDINGYKWYHYDPLWSIMYHCFLDPWGTCQRPLRFLVGTWMGMFSHDLQKSTHLQTNLRLAASWGTDGRRGHKVRGE